MNIFGKLSAVLPALLAAAAVPIFADSLTINATFDTSLTTADDSAIDAAIAAIEGDITSPHNLTVSLYFTSMSSGLGESKTGYYDLSYYAYYNAFAGVATQPDQLTALASLPAPKNPISGNPVTGSDQIVVTSAEGRNLGFNAPASVAANGGTYDSEISLNTSITYPPGSNNGSNYALQAVATHEIDEALGIGGSGSDVGGIGFFADPADLDLYRYTCSDSNVATTLTCLARDVSRSYSTLQTTSPFSYFSIDGGLTVLSFFNQTLAADYGDWLSNPIPGGFGPQVQDAYGETGTNLAPGVNEIASFNTIGYRIIVPEPGTATMLCLALLALGVIADRRRRRSNRLSIVQ